MKSSILKLTTSGVATLIIGAGALFGATVYHVPGDFSTVQAAYDACNPGDTVIVADGIYMNTNNGGQSDVLHMNKSGSPGAPITVEATNIFGAILDGQGLNSSDGYKTVVYIDTNCSYNIVRGFQIRKGYHGGVDIWGSYNQILQCDIYTNGDFGDPDPNNGFCGINDLPSTANNSYIGNYIHDNGRISQASPYDHGIYLCGTNNEVVINNLIVGNCAAGIQVAGYNGVANMDIYNNTIVSNRNGDGIILWMEVDGVKIANNVLYGNAHYGIGTWACTSSNYLLLDGAVKIQNNLFYNNSYGTWDMTLGGSTVSYTASGNITDSDPEFFNSASDWHLQKCSPAIDSGLTLAPVTSDFDGLPRPIPLDPDGAYDIGAYER